MAQLVGRKLLNRYRVDEALGRGGMAEVYKVWDEQRAVYLAMKLLRDDLAEDRVFLRRFKREGQTLSKLQHPNIVRFYGLEQESSQAFMLMEFIDGHALRREIFDAKGPMPMGRVMEITQATCSALHFAHNQGFVHSDVKPGNILIDQSGRAHLTDFGIARMTEAATSTMVGIGTPAYMAPEQIRGEDPTPQSDIYSFGVVLYEMVTGGERPFTGERSQTTGSNSERVRWEHIYLDPPPPSKFNPKLPKAFEAAILKCLEKEPQKRFRSTLEMLNAFQAALQPKGKAAAALAPAPEVEAPTVLEASSPAETPVAPPYTPVAAGEFVGEATKRRASPILWILIGALVVAVGGLAITSLGGGGGLLPGGQGGVEAQVQMTMDVQNTEIAQQTKTAEDLNNLLTASAPAQSNPPSGGQSPGGNPPAATSVPTVQPSNTPIPTRIPTETPTEETLVTVTIRNDSVWDFVVTLESTGETQYLSGGGSVAYFTLTPGTYRFLWTAPQYPLGGTCGSSTLVVSNTVNFNETWIIVNGKECASIKNPP